MFNDVVHSLNKMINSFYQTPSHTDIYIIMKNEISYMNYYVVTYILKRHTQEQRLKTGSKFVFFIIPVYAKLLY